MFISTEYHLVVNDLDRNMSLREIHLQEVIQSGILFVSDYIYLIDLSGITVDGSHAQEDLTHV